MSRRLKIVRLSHGFLAELLRVGERGERREMVGMPRSGRIVHVDVTSFWQGNRVALYVESEEFPETKHGERLGPDDEFNVSATVFDPRACLTNGHAKEGRHTRCCCGAIEYNDDGTLRNSGDAKYLCGYTVANNPLSGTMFSDRMSAKEKTEEYAFQARKEAMEKLHADGSYRVPPEFVEELKRLVDERNLGPAFKACRESVEKRLEGDCDPSPVFVPVNLDAQPLMSGIPCSLVTGARDDNSSYAAPASAYDLTIEEKCKLIAERLKTQHPNTRVNKDGTLVSGLTNYLIDEETPQS